MKLWQFGLLLAQQQLILAHLANGLMAIVFAVIGLLMVVPSIVLCAAEVRR